MYFLTLALSATVALAAIIPPPAPACDLACTSDKQCIVNPDNGHAACLAQRGCRRDSDCETDEDGAASEQVCHLYCGPKGHVSCEIAGGYCVPK